MRFDGIHALHMHLIVLYAGSVPSAMPAEIFPSNDQSSVFKIMLMTNHDFLMTNHDYFIKIVMHLVLKKHSTDMSCGLRSGPGAELTGTKW
jgi:hypothetical protein